MKKAYESPRMMVEIFSSDAFCADEACGTGHTVYNFECNAGSSSASYNVYTDDGTPYATYRSNDLSYGVAKKEMGGYHPCGATHSASSDSGFIKGYMYKQDTRGFFPSYEDTGSKIPVMIWTEGGYNVHCTTNLDMNSWTTAKS